MSLFSILDVEGEIQIGDKTRFSAYKSFATKESLDISSITIKPGADGNAVSVFSQDKNEWYLDWAFSDSSIDVDSYNNDLIFIESSGANVSTTLTSGTYTLAQYATHVASKMTSSGTQTYNGSVLNNVITISATGSFQFKSCSVQQQLHIDINDSSNSIESDYVCYGLKSITCDIANSEAIPITDSKSFYVKVLTENGDYLFSNDSDLVAHEPDIMKWVSDGRASFKNIHRRAQKLIMQWIDENAFTDIYGNKYSKRDIIDIDEVKQWSIFMTLKLIFNGLSNQVDDIFDRKAKSALDLENGARKRAVVRLDTDKSGTLGQNEGIWIGSGELFRR